MAEELASANVNRSYSLAAMSIAIFTFMLFFLYPRFKGGEIDPLMFQATLIVMGMATFSFVFSTFAYYRVAIGQTDDRTKVLLARQGDRFWLFGYTLLFLAPSLILVTVGLLVVGVVWFSLWLIYLMIVIRLFPKMQAKE